MTFKLNRNPKTKCVLGNSHEYKMESIGPDCRAIILDYKQDLEETHLHKIMTTILNAEFHQAWQNKQIKLWNRDHTDKCIFVTVFEIGLLDDEVYVIEHIQKLAISAFWFSILNNSKFIFA